jgi:hypothetical protein
LKLFLSSLCHPRFYPCPRICCRYIRNLHIFNTVETMVSFQIYPIVKQASKRFRTASNCHS